jgi:DNA-binding PadR family transcriptional regulator
VALRLARSWLTDPRPEPGGRARRHYHLTPAGLSWLQREHARTTALWRGVPTAGR